MIFILIEDESLIAFALEEALGNARFKTTGLFAPCADALASLERDWPEVAVPDTVLKDSSSLELARGLVGRNIPFVIVSGREQHDVSTPNLNNVE